MVSLQQEYDVKVTGFYNLEKANSMTSLNLAKIIIID